MVTLTWSWPGVGFQRTKVCCPQIRKSLSMEIQWHSFILALQIGLNDLKYLEEPPRMYYVPEQDMNYVLKKESMLYGDI
jgi:hypothetical protein